MTDTIYLILHTRSQQEYTERRYYDAAQDHSDILGFTEAREEAEAILDSKYRRTSTLSGNIYWTDPDDEEEYVPEGEDEPYNPWQYEIVEAKRL